MGFKEGRRAEGDASFVAPPVPLFERLPEEADADDWDNARSGAPDAAPAPCRRCEEELCAVLDRYVFLDE